VAKLESTPAACNALYLRAVLDELRQFGRHEELQAKAAGYLSAPAPPELFDRILSRWEEDFGVDLVRQTLSLIWAARHGLSESEILDLLGKLPTCAAFDAHTELSKAEILERLKEIREPWEPMPRATWEPFFFASESGFVVRAGLLTFSHAYLREAVERRYLPTPQAKRSAHERLASYFELRPLPAHRGADGSLHLERKAVATSRALDEEPWQLQAAGCWEALADHLSLLPVFEAACATGREFEWMQYWQRVLSAVRKAVAPVVDIPNLYLSEFRQLSQEEKTLLGGTLGNFLLGLVYFDAARECFKEEAKADVFANDRFLRAGNLNDRGLPERDQGHEKEALRLFEEAAALLDEGNPPMRNKSRHTTSAACLPPFS
jgi:tetratricopeptide (TPR) repeat protein